MFINQAFKQALLKKIIRWKVGLEKDEVLEFWSRGFGVRVFLVMGSSGFRNLFIYLSLSWGVLKSLVWAKRDEFWIPGKWQCDLDMLW